MRRRGWTFIVTAMFISLFATSASGAGGTGGISLSAGLTPIGNGEAGSGSGEPTYNDAYAMGWTGLETQASVNLAVNPLDPATLTGLTISNDPGVMCDQSSSKFTATASWDNGTTSVVPATWSVSPTTYASIDASTGVLTTYDTHEVSVTVQASYTFNDVTKTATRTVGITDCHVDGPIFGCAAVGPARKTNHMDLAGAYAILILVLGLFKVRGSRRRKR